MKVFEVFRVPLVVVVSLVLVVVAVGSATAATAWTGPHLSLCQYEDDEGEVWYAYRVISLEECGDLDRSFHVVDVVPSDCEAFTVEVMVVEGSDICSEMYKHDRQDYTLDGLYGLLDPDWVLQRDQLQSLAGPNETVSIRDGGFVVTDTSGDYHEGWSSEIAVTQEEYLEVEGLVSAYEDRPSVATFAGINRKMQKSGPVSLAFLFWYLDEDDTHDSGVSDINYVLDTAIVPYLEDNPDAFVQYHGDGLFGYNNGAKFMLSLGALEWHGTSGDRVDVMVDYERLHNHLDAGNHEAITSFSVNLETNKVEVSVYDDPDNPPDLEAMKEELAQFETVEVSLDATPRFHLQQPDPVDPAEEPADLEDDPPEPETKTLSLGERISSYIPDEEIKVPCSLGAQWTIGAGTAGEVQGGITAGHCTRNLLKSKTTSSFPWANWGRLERLLYGEGNEIGRTGYNYMLPFHPGDRFFPVNSPLMTNLDVMSFDYHDLDDLDFDEWFPGSGAPANASSKMTYRYENDLLPDLVTVGSYQKEGYEFDRVSLFNNPYQEIKDRGTLVCASGVPIGSEMVSTKCSKILNPYYTYFEEWRDPNNLLRRKNRVILLEGSIWETGMDGGPVFIRNEDGSVHIIGILQGDIDCVCPQRHTVFVPFPLIHQRMQIGLASLSWVVG